MESESLEVYQLAHDFRDKLRSSDVLLTEDITFLDLHLNQEVLDGLKKCGFLRPSPVQLKSIPLGRCGFDLVIQSKAGTGKTCVFALVALEALRFNQINSTQTLIIAPTREVALQIHEVISLIGSSHKGLKCSLCIGGIDIKQDRARLSGGSQILIGTPGRVKQLIGLNILKTQQIELFVLDEADKLMDEQFKKQIDEIYKCLPRDKQMIATSATYPNELDTFLKQYMQLPQSIRVGEEIRLEAMEEFYLISKAGSSARKDIENKLESLKELLINELSFTKCFVFTNYQARAPLICDNLNKDEKFVAKHGYASYLCAELAQSDRNEIFKKFKNSQSQRLLISTDVSARGIDIRDIDVVINFDLPNENITYYHRIGRAGRFGQPGKAFTIVSTGSMDRALFQRSVKSDKIKQYMLKISK